MLRREFFSPWPISSVSAAATVFRSWRYRVVCRLRFSNECDQSLTEDRFGGAGRVRHARVHDEDTDFSGLAYHASYLRWCERGGSDWLRLLGGRHNQLISGPAPAAFVLRKLCIDYFQPAKIDDVLDVTSACEELTAATLTLSQKLRRDGVLLAKVEVLIVLVNAKGRPMRLPVGVKEAFG